MPYGQQCRSHRPSVIPKRTIIQMGSLYNNDTPLWYNCMWKIYVNLCDNTWYIHQTIRWWYYASLYLLNISWHANLSLFFCDKYVVISAQFEIDDGFHVLMISYLTYSDTICINSIYPSINKACHFESISNQLATVSFEYLQIPLDKIKKKFDIV